MFPYDDSLRGPYATYRSSSLDTRFGAALDDDTDPDLLDEIERLRAALLAERARVVWYDRYAGDDPSEWPQGEAYQQALRDCDEQAREDLIAEGLLPPE